VSQPTVVRAEEREVAGTISLQTLQKFADALGCDVVYCLIPRVPLHQSVEIQARKVASAEAATVAHSLGLEWQVVPPPAQMMVLDEQVRELVDKRPSNLWDLWSE